MSVQPDCQPPLDEPVCGSMPLAEAAYRLGLSKADVCLLVLEGRIRKAGAGTVDANDVLDLASSRPRAADRRRRDPGRLPRTTESLLWLLADWGGRGRTADLASALEVSWQSTYEPLARLTDTGLVQRARKDCIVTSDGWDYVKRYQRMF